MEDVEDLDAADLTRELIGVFTARELAGILDTKISTVNSWRYAWYVSPREPQRTRLKTTFEVVRLLAVIDGFAVDQWFFTPSRDGRTPAQRIAQGSGPELHRELLALIRDVG